MKNLLFFVFLLIGTLVVNSQQLYFESGKTISSFDYENSQGQALENLHSTNHTFMNIGYRKNIFYNNLFLHLNGSYNGYGAIGSDRLLDNYFEWDLNYLGIGVGLDYEIFKPGNFSLYIKGLATAEFFIQGTQTLNNQVYNLVKEDDFDPAIINLRGGLGIIYKVSETISAFTQYMYSGSVTSANIQGSLKIHAHHVGFGILVKVSKKKAATD